MNLKVKPWQPWGVLLIVGAVWEGVTQLGWVNHFFIPPLSQVFLTGWRLACSGELFYHTLLSVGRAELGLLLALLTGIPLGVAVAVFSRKVRLVLEPLLNLAAQLNPLVLFHLFLLTLGVGESSKVVIIAWTSVWPILLSTVSGTLNVDPDLFKLGQSFGLRRWGLLRKVIIPAAAPTIYTGIRLSAGYSFFLLLAVEMLGVHSGLGSLIIKGQEYYRTPVVFAAAGTIALLGMGFDTLLQRLGTIMLKEEPDESA